MLNLPGASLPVEEWHEDLFENAYHVRITAREVAMLAMMNEITDKHDWHKKVYDETIAAKWTAEAVSAGLSENMSDWCIAELRDKAKIYEHNGVICVFDVDTVVAKSDVAVGEVLREKLKSTLQEFRNSQQDDWHPKSNAQVLDLVHPSLYPLVYGETRVLEEGQILTCGNCIAHVGQGKVLPLPTRSQPVTYAETTYSPWSYRYQWLPCEVQVIGGHAKITSYVNSLHPEHHDSIYTLIEQLIDRSIPLWHECLQIEARAEFNRIACGSAEYDSQNPNEGTHNDDDELRKRVEQLAQPEGIVAICREDEDVMDAAGEDDAIPLEEWVKTEDALYYISECVWKTKRRLVLPEPGPYNTTKKPWDSQSIQDQEVPSTNKGLSEPSAKRPRTAPPTVQPDWTKRGLQIIVKIASIELSPSNPAYTGGSWHLEGMQNEHIAATSLFYYDSHNVTPSRLRFRRQAHLDHDNVSYEQGDFDGLEVIFGLPKGGLDGGSSAVQELGSVLTKQGRLLAFPNVLQHKVEAFELEDKTKPGWRKFVALWLVDPSNKVISTANVPPQQFEWWREAADAQTGFESRLPRELADQVEAEGGKMTMTREQAVEHRLRLMEERTSYVTGVEREWQSETYNFCEH
jgi:hypothetical protein